MQSVEIRGLDKVTKMLEDAPGIIREARAEVLEDLGQELLGAVQHRIGGSGRVAGVQEYDVGSGKGYVAVRAKAETKLDGYAAGYVTNALENGHAIRRPSGTSKRYRSRAKIAAVPGKHMYRDTREMDADRLAENGAREIERTAIRKLNGG